MAVDVTDASGDIGRLPFDARGTLVEAQTGGALMYAAPELRAEKAEHCVERKQHLNKFVRQVFVSLQSAISGAVLKALPVAGHCPRSSKGRRAGPRTCIDRA